MSLRLVFLLGLIGFTQSIDIDTENLEELFSYDSDDVVDDGIDLGGFGIDIYEIEDNSNPLLVLFNDDDADDYVYCLEFIQVDEVTAYRGFEDWDETSPARQVVFDDLLASDWVYESSGESCLEDTAPDNCYSFRFANIGSSSGANWEWFNITGRIQEDSTGASQYVVKFDLDITGYSWQNVSNNLVVTLVLSDCSEEFEDVDSSEGSEEEDTEEDDDEDDEDSEESTTEDPSEDEDIDALNLLVKKQSHLYGLKKHSIRWKGERKNNKRQLQDSEDTSTTEEASDEETEDEEDDSASSGAGISSDDSGEVDLNSAFFRIQPTGLSCDENMTDYNVNVSLAVDPSTDYDDISIELRINYFGNCFDYDPEVGEDTSKLETDNAFTFNLVQITIVSLISFAVFMFV